MDTVHKIGNKKSEAIEHHYIGIFDVLTHRSSYTSGGLQGSPGLWASLLMKLDTAAHFLIHRDSGGDEKHSLPKLGCQLLGKATFPTSRTTQD